MTHAPAPPAIPADDKDWTWVLREPCGECGFVTGTVEVGDLAEAIRATVPRWTIALAAPDASVRPAPTTWSTLEYAAHVRDVYRLFARRARAMLARDDPAFDNWDQDATAVADRYDLQDPLAVAGELATSAAELVSLVESVPAGGWERTGRRSNSSTFTVRTLLQYGLHDVVHHLHDVGA